jgi:hypothetical protein
MIFQEYHFVATSKYSRTSVCLERERQDIVGTPSGQSRVPKKESVTPGAYRHNTGASKDRLPPHGEQTKP